MIAAPLLMGLDYFMVNPGFTIAAFLVMGIVFSFGLFLVVGDITHKLDK